MMHRDLIALREKAIPSLLEARSRHVDYRSYSIDTSSNYFGEELVDITTLGIRGRNYYNRTDNPPYYESIPGSLSGLYLRATVARKLAGVDRRLHDLGLRVFVHDALRPIEVQRYFHDTWMPARVRKRYPHFDEAQVMKETEIYWAKPSESELSPSPHGSGGALDVTLAFAESGDLLYMGSIFDDACVLASTNYFEPHGDALQRDSDDEARANRRVLYWVMTDAGFANYPNEWWHFSWGDQMWGKMVGERAAHYGLAPMPGG
jgi:D-alanyl-D-alanine dipeptidase